MSRHIADHRVPSRGARMKNFVLIARGSSLDEGWRKLWQQPVTRTDSNRRIVEYMRIARGHRA